MGPRRGWLQAPPGAPAACGACARAGRNLAPASWPQWPSGGDRLGIWPRRRGQLRMRTGAGRARRSLIVAVRKCDVLFVLLHDLIDGGVIATNPNLRAIASQATTPENIDLAAATALRIPVTVVPPIVTEATADLAFGLMLAVARR